MENQPERQENSLESILERAATKKDVLIILQAAVGQIEAQLEAQLKAHFEVQSNNRQKKTEKNPSKPLNAPNATNEYCEQEQEEAGRDMRQFLFEQDISVPIGHVNKLLLKLSDLLEGKTVSEDVEVRVENFQRRSREALHSLPKDDMNAAMIGNLAIIAEVVRELASSEPTGTAKKWAGEAVLGIHNLLATNNKTRKVSEESLRDLCKNFQEQIGIIFEKENDQEKTQKAETSKKNNEDNFFSDPLNYME